MGKGGGGGAKERNYDLQLLSIKADFHSVQNVPRSTFYDCLLSTNRQAEQISLAVVDCKHFKFRKQSQKIDRATFCTEWKSVFTRCSQPFSKSFPVNYAGHKGREKRHILRNTFSILARLETGNWD